MIRETVLATGYAPRAIFELLLNTSQFELELKEVIYCTFTTMFY